MSSAANYGEPGWRTPDYLYRGHGWMMHGYVHHGHGYAVPGWMMGGYGHDVGYDNGPSAAMYGVMAPLIVAGVLAVVLLVRRWPVGSRSDPAHGSPR